MSSHIVEKDYRAKDYKAFFSLITVMVNGLAGMIFSLSESWPLIILGQLQLTVLIWHCFTLMHSCGHDAYFATRKFNIYAGHLVSLFSFIPFYAWKYHHNAHHVWVGHESKDPSLSPSEEAPPQKVLRFLDWCWTFWIPIFSLYYAIFNFWILKNTFAHFPERIKKQRMKKSLLFVVAGHILFYILFGIEFQMAFIIPALLFLASSDVILLSQHAFFDGEFEFYSGNKPFAFKDQNHFSRTIYSNKWFDRYVLLNFNLHNVHHQYPYIPHYYLDQVEFQPYHETNLIEWTKLVKGMKVKDLFFGDPK